MFKALMFITALFFLTGCGKEVGRVRFLGEGSSSVTTALSAGRVGFWTDIDLVYDGSGKLEYRVALVQGGTRVATAVCEPLAPLGTVRSWVEVDRGSVHLRKGQGKMDCSATLPKAGATTAEVELVFAARPHSSTIKRADLVLKQ
jgi:hypothetical protein